MGTFKNLKEATKEAFEYSKSKGYGFTKKELRAEIKEMREDRVKRFGKPNIIR